MEEKKSRHIAVVMFLLAVSLSSGGGSTGSDCSTTTAETNRAKRLLSAVVDTQRAKESQKQHLEALFNRWAPHSLTLSHPDAAITWSFLTIQHRTGENIMETILICCFKSNTDV